MYVFVARERRADRASFYIKLELSGPGARSAAKSFLSDIAGTDMLIFKAMDANDDDIHICGTVRTLGCC